jgi:5-methylcytosine-specific restriction protein B
VFDLTLEWLDLNSTYFVRSFATYEAEDEAKNKDSVVYNNRVVEVKTVLPEDVWIGQSYFIMKDDDGKDCTRLKIEYEIIPILKEYIKDGIFKDVEKVNEVIKSLREYESEDD